MAFSALVTKRKLINEYIMEKKNNENNMQGEGQVNSKGKDWGTCTCIMTGDTVG